MREKRKLSESDEMVGELAKRGRRVKLLRSIPGIGPFFSALDKAKQLLY